MKFLREILLSVITLVIITTGIRAMAMRYVDSNSHDICCTMNLDSLSSQDNSDRNYNSYSKPCILGAEAFSLSVSRLPNASSFSQIKKNRLNTIFNPSNGYEAYLRNGNVFGAVGTNDIRSGNPHFPSSSLQNEDFLYSLCNLLI